mgnify:CR=1 FL=1
MLSIVILRNAKRRKREMRKVEIEKQWMLIDNQDIDLQDYFVIYAGENTFQKV